MIHRNLQLHNVSELEEIKGQRGLRLQRFPEKVRGGLGDWGKVAAQLVSNAEIRFVPQANKVSFTLASYNDKASVEVWFGEFQSAHHFELDETPLRIDLDFNGPHWQSPAYVLKLPENARGACCFSPRVCRLRFWSGGVPHIHLLETPPVADVRLPLKEEIPQRTLCAYGTSITYGCRATAAHLSYPAVCAARLGVDLLNLGMPGSAFCEKEMADHIAARCDWDVGVLELSVNMVAAYSVEDFYKRTSSMINIVSGSDPSRLVFCVTMLPYHDDYVEELSSKLPFGKPDEYREALRHAFAACPHANIRLIEGGDLLTDIRGLGSDLIHPGDYGMIAIGNKLADKIRQMAR